MVPDDRECVVDGVVMEEIVWPHRAVIAGGRGRHPVDGEGCVVFFGDVGIETSVVLHVGGGRRINSGVVRDIGHIREAVSYTWLGGTFVGKVLLAEATCERRAKV